jgi:hypothetical protein
MRSRTYLNVSLGILALALAYHFGAQAATAQSASPVRGIAAYYVSNCGLVTEVVGENGDVYRNCSGTWSYVGNPFSGATAVEQTSFGSLKARYRGEREP